MSAVYDDPRSLLSELFRQPFVKDHFACDWVPRDPSDSWASVHPYWGYDHIPYDLSKSKVFGRIIRDNRPNSPFPNECFALISLRENHPFIPPHPGRGPDYLDDYAHPNLIFSDGSLGCWDPRNFPQLYDPRRPWVGYHSLPSPQGDTRRRLENWSTVEYYDFTGAVLPYSGGCWKLPEIEALLKRRDFIERNLVDDIAGILESLRDHYGSHLPFLDPLTMETVLTWRSWSEGRDSIGRTQRYIAELVAIKRWLNVILSPQEHHSVRADLTGVWVATVPTDVDWSYLLRSPLPLYTLLRILDHHPLYLQAEWGLISHGECNRINALDAVLHRPTRNVPELETISRSPYRLREPLPGTIPAAIRRPSQVLPSGRRCIDWDLSFISCPFLHRPPSAPSSLPVLKELRKKRQRENRACRGPAILPANASSIHPSPRNHPILAVLPDIRSPGIQPTYFIEKEGAGFAWAVHVSRFRYKRERHLLDETYTYYFDIGDNVFLWSNNPLPDDPTCLFSMIEGRKPNPFRELKYVKEAPPTYVSHNNPSTGALISVFAPGVPGPTGIFLDGSTTTDAASTVEQPEAAMHPSYATQSSGHTFMTPRTTAGTTSISSVQLPHLVANTPKGLFGLRSGEPHDLSPKDAVSTQITPMTQQTLVLDERTLKSDTDLQLLHMPDGAVTIPPVVEAPTSPSAFRSEFDRLLDTMRYQRHRASSFLSFRLCLTFAPSSSISPLLALSKVPSTNLICYAIRLSNVSTSLSVPDIVAISRRDNWGEIITISSTKEPDFTVSVEIGFRFPEDALIMLSRHGLKYEGRYWAIRPVLCISGICQFPNIDFSPTTSNNDCLLRRYKRLRIFTSLEEVLESSSPYLAQMATLLSQLRSQLGSLPEPTLYPKEILLEELQQVFPLATLHKVSPPPVIPRTVYISRRVSLNLDGTVMPLEKSTSIWLEYQKEELDFDEVIPNRFIPRRTRQRLVDRDEDGSGDPSAAAPMNSRERFQAVRLVYKFAQEKFRVWNSPTISLVPPPPNITGAREIVGNLVTIWKWYDSALVQAKAARDAAMADPHSPLDLLEAHDAAVNAFSFSCRSLGVYGPDFERLREALQQATTTNGQ